MSVMNQFDVNGKEESLLKFDFSDGNFSGNKTIIKNNYELHYYKTNDLHIFNVMLSDEDLNKFQNDFNLLKIHVTKGASREYWFEFKNCNVVFKENEKAVYDSFISDTLGLELVNKNKKLIGEY